ncbi:kexin [Malassezia nana]|uniref:Kexin n=1 Tax=Malassezia nana TaxID=180528 RepID=A0AAF0EJL9_9BASI|nr:kexin [Malassezia nana]
MRFTLCAYGILWLAAFNLAERPAKRTYDSHHYYVAELRASESCNQVPSPEHVAQALDAELVERVGELRHHWLLRAPKTDELARRSVLGEVDEQQDPVLRRYASWKHTDLERRTCVGEHCVSLGCLSASVRSLERQKVRWRHKRSVIYDPETMRDIYPTLLPPVPITEAWMNGRAPIPARNWTAEFAKTFQVQDPLFYKQWHLVNNDLPGHDLHLDGAWKAATGKNVTVSLIDDGIDYSHPDLADNFDAQGSYDFNDHTALPEPRLSEDMHGTRCAGEIAALKNDICGVGVAPDAHVSGVRILSGPISDADEAAALNYGYQTSSIYSCSWGPSDNGQSMDAPKGLVAKALLNGIYHGRQGRGSLFVFAGGNGGASDDQCNFDGYTNSIYTITIAAVDSQGHRPYYSEMCSAIIASSWSSGKGEMIYTTNVRGEYNRTCTSSHGGTSAAAPLVAGMLALALEVRPDLTWRDAQHLLIKASSVTSPDDPDWQRTAAGYMYSHKFGFGVVDATRLVEEAKKHKLVPPQAWYEMPRQSVNRTIPARQAINSTFTITRDMIDKANLASLEHVTATFWIQHRRRGDVKVVLYGPHGTKSVLASPRRYDNDKGGFPGWTFMTLKHWDEVPIGTWTAEVSDYSQIEKREGNEEAGQFEGWSLSLWGAAKNASLARPWNFPKDSAEYTMHLPAAPNTTVLGSPPVVLPTASPQASSSRLLIKPTHALPTDHFQDPGETEHVFGQSYTPQKPEADTVYLPWSSGLSKMAYILAGILILALLVLGLYLLHRRYQTRQSGRYQHVPADDEAIQLHWQPGDRGGASQLQTRDLYDAFALHDEELDDEQASETVTDTKKSTDQASPSTDT